MVTAGHRELKSKFRMQKTEYRFCVFCNIFYFRSLQIITKIKQIMPIFLAFCFHTKYFYLKKYLKQSKA